MFLFFKKNKALSWTLRRWGFNDRRFSNTKYEDWQPTWNGHGDSSVRALCLMLERDATSNCLYDYRNNASLENGDVQILHSPGRCALLHPAFMPRERERERWHRWCGVLGMYLGPTPLQAPWGWGMKKLAPLYWGTPLELHHHPKWIISSFAHNLLMFWFIQETWKFMSWVTCEMYLCCRARCKLRYVLSLFSIIYESLASLYKRSSWFPLCGFHCPLSIFHPACTPFPTTIIRSTHAQTARSHIVWTLCKLSKSKL